MSLTVNEQKVSELVARKADIERQIGKIGKTKTEAKEAIDTQYSSQLKILYTDLSAISDILSGLKSLI